MADEKKAKGEQAASPKGEKPAKREGGKKAGKKAAGGGGSGADATLKAVSSSAEVVPPRMLGKYREEVIPALTKQFQYKNANQVPRLEKIVVNMGLGAAVANPKIIDTAVEELRAASGQKPIVT